LCRPISGGSPIWQANQAQVGTTTWSAQSAISRGGALTEGRVDHQLVAMCGRLNWRVSIMKQMRA